jgi:plastocyanin
VSFRAVRLIAVGVAACCAATLLAGCSNTKSPNVRRPHTGSTTASTVDGVQQVTVQANDEFRFVPSTITVHPGKVHLTLVHTGSGAPHNWQLNGFPTDAVPLIQAGQQASITFTTPSPGSYTFVCTIHVNQGQTGTLVVLPN